MKRLLLPLIAALSLPSGIKAEEPYYSNTWMGIDYQLFINDKEPLDNGYMYKFRTRYESDLRTKVVDSRIADCILYRFKFPIPFIIIHYNDKYI